MPSGIVIGTIPTERSSTAAGRWVAVGGNGRCISHAGRAELGRLRRSQRAGFRGSARRDRYMPHPPGIGQGWRMGDDQPWRRSTDKYLKDIERAKLRVYHAACAAVQEGLSLEWVHRIAEEAGRDSVGMHVSRANRERADRLGVNDPAPRSDPTGDPPPSPGRGPKPDRP